MATNKVQDNGFLGAVVVTNPTTPVSGDPVRYGSMTGVALTDESGGGNDAGETSVDFGPSIWDVPVDDNEGTGIAVGDEIYYHDTPTGSPATHLNNSATGANGFFGYAEEVVGANATTTINVRHAPLGLTSTTASEVDTGQISNAAVTTAKIADANVTAAKLDNATAGLADGLGVLRVARATFDPTATSGQRTVAAHGLGVTLPIKAVVVGGFVDVITTFTSATDAGTVAISVEGANDVVSAIAISNGANPWDAGKHAIVPKANTPESTGVKTTAAREITATVAVEALTAGKAVVFLYYVVSA